MKSFVGNKALSVSYCINDDNDNDDDDDLYIYMLKYSTLFYF